MLHELVDPDTLHDPVCQAAYLLLQIQPCSARQQRLLYPLSDSEALRQPAAIKGCMGFNKSAHQELPLDKF